MDVLNDLKRTARPWVCPFDRILASIPQRAAVFDLGCGSGFLLGLVAAAKDPATLGGAEIAPALVAATQAHLRAKAPRIPIAIHLYDGLSLPDSIKFFDAVTLIDVLHHVPPVRQRTFLQAVHNAMAENATLILKDIDAARSILCLANKVHDLLSSGEAGHELRKDVAANTLRSVGFEIELSWSVRRLWYPHYCFVCKKAPVASPASSSGAVAAE
jgi:2-polyprenyl-3-methyl-5-hydroxy-6-metoxy-1,4-benzoquinol methylase